MPSSSGHGFGAATNQSKAQLATAYNELGKELSSQKVRVVGNYTLGKVIGEGTYGKVRLGTHRLSSTRVAIKQIPKALSAQLTREIHHHRRLQHPHVTQLYEVIATESYIWLVTELCAGGELFDYLVEKGRLSEDETRAIFGQLCLAVAYIHEKGVVHRDLKLENVLLDERCRVKLGDFGFTREFERGCLLDTFCGTTGYASPEMLLGKKYFGQEVDVWSLGIILYALLTGTLPFDDDDEDVMRDKIIKGEYEDQEWLTPDARDLIRRILVQEPSKRLTISQILSHKWFTDPMPSAPAFRQTRTSRPPSWEPQYTHAIASVPPSLDPMPEGSTTNSSAFSHASSNFAADVADMFDAHPESTPTTPDESNHSHHPYHLLNVLEANIQRSNSQVTLTTPHEQPHSSPFLPVAEEADERGSNKSTQEERDDALARLTAPGSSRPTPPPQFPTRTPVRTKRRSVSSTLSQDSAAGGGASTPSTPAPILPRVDFAGLMTVRAPVLFSTPLDRDLLNTLAMLGFDTGQMVHSVLSDACDASSALWWMLRKKAEERRLDRERDKMVELEAERDKMKQARSKPMPPVPVSTSLPELAFVPATPVTPSFAAHGAEDSTPLPASRSIDEARAGLVAYVAGARKNAHTTLPPIETTSVTASPPVTKPRSASVSMLQRVGLAVTRKKSEERVRDRERVHSSPGGLPGAPPIPTDAANTSSELEPRTPNRKLTKSPPVGGKGTPTSAVPWSPNDSIVNLTPNAAWTFGLSSPPSSLVGHGSALSHESHDAPTVRMSAEPHAALAGSSRSTVASNTGSTGAASGGRNRASILNAFKQWFQDDRKGKKRRPPPIPIQQAVSNPQTPSPSTPYDMHDRDRTVRASGRKKRAKRASVGSHRSGRSSSVNSRRSSTSRVDAQGGSGLGHALGLARSTSNTSSRRRVGTPESGGFGQYAVRPPLHGKTSSGGSMGSAHRHPSGMTIAQLAALRRGGAASPMMRHHARVGSGSSTRVVRQAKAMPHAVQSLFNPSHNRTGSAASSSGAQSVSSSRRGSWLHERERADWDESASPSQAVSDAEGPLLFETPRRPPQATFVQRRSGTFGTPNAGHGSAGRNSWKKSWGREPPGWSARATQVVPVEVLALDYPASGISSNNVRDVFSGSGRAIIDAGDDDSDWIDEDDEDVDAFARGFGQVGGARAKQPSPVPSLTLFKRSMAPLPLPPSSHARGRSGSGKGRHSPVATNMPLPAPPPETVKNEGMPDARATRRGQLATSSFKNPIVEEDEDEE